MPRGNQPKRAAAVTTQAAAIAPEPKKKRERRPPSQNATWVNSAVAQAFLQINPAHLSRLKGAGDIRTKDNVYNFKDLCDRFVQKLQTDGLIDQRVEAACISEFKRGAVPDEVIEKLGYGWSVVKLAWQSWVEVQNDPERRRVLAEREAAQKAAQKADEVVRCRECLRTPALAAEDSLRIVREVTEDQSRTNLSIDEERACTGIALRCSVCLAIKGTAPVNEMRARIRILRVVGPPKPVVLAPLPLAPVVASTAPVPAEDMTGTTGE